MTRGHRRARRKRRRTQFSFNEEHLDGEPPAGRR